MKTEPDPRRHAWRADLADRALAGRIKAQRFVDPVPRRVIAPTAPIRHKPRFDATLDTEALHGETVHVFEETAEGWSWVQLATDGYVGYAPSAMLAPAASLPTHRVSVLRTFLYPGPDMKLPPQAALSMASLVTVVARKPPFAMLEDGSAVIARHLAPLDEFASDFVTVAEGFLGTPYLWGGRTSLGIDCSALVQIALLMAGVDAPRDSDMQLAEIGERLDITATRPRRGDLVFWPGHVGIMRNGKTLLHANAHHMLVASEPLRAARARIAAAGADIICLRRPPPSRSAPAMPDPSPQTASRPG